MVVQQWRMRNFWIKHLFLEFTHPEFFVEQELKIFICAKHSQILCFCNSFPSIFPRFVDRLIYKLYQYKYILTTKILYFLIFKWNEIIWSSMNVKCNAKEMKKKNADNFYMYVCPMYFYNDNCWMASDIDFTFSNYKIQWVASRSELANW